MTATVAAAFPASEINLDNGVMITLAAQGAGTTSSAIQSNPRATGIKLVVDITAISGTPTLTVTLRGRDRASGKTWNILVSAALAAVATTVLTVYPGAVVTANVSANDRLPPSWDVTAVIAGGTPSVTGTISAQTLI